MMTSMKKKVLAVSLVISIIAILSMGTLAWFQDDDLVTNDFMIADSDDTPDDVFSVDVYEEHDVDGDGVIEDDEKNLDGITYNEQEVTPGAVLPKKAFVENTGKFDQYVRVKATISDIGVWLDVLGIDPANIGTAAAPALSNFFVVGSGFDNLWHRNDAETVYDEQASTLTFVYYFKGVLKADADPVPFLEAVKIPTELTREDVVGMDGEFSIKLLAEAVQSVNMGDFYTDDHVANAIQSFDIAFGQ